MPFNEFGENTNVPFTSAPQTEIPRPSSLDQLRSTIKSIYSTADLDGAEQMLTAAAMNRPELRDEVKGMISQRRADLARVESVPGYQEKRTEGETKIWSEINEEIQNSSLLQLNALSKVGLELRLMESGMTSSEIDENLDILLYTMSERRKALINEIYGEVTSLLFSAASLQELNEKWTLVERQALLMRRGLTAQEAADDAALMEQAYASRRDNLVGEYYSGVWGEMNAATLQELQSSFTPDLLKQRLVSAGLNETEQVDVLNNLLRFRATRLVETSDSLKDLTA